MNNTKYPAGRISLVGVVEGGEGWDSVGGGGGGEGHQESLGKSRRTSQKSYTEPHF